MTLLTHFNPRARVLTLSGSSKEAALRNQPTKTKAFVTPEFIGRIDRGNLRKFAYTFVSSSAKLQSDRSMGT